MIAYCTLKTRELGELLLVANPKELIGIYFLDCKHAPKGRDGWRLDPKHSVLKRACREVLEYLKGERKGFSVPVRYEGTAFQRSVWGQIARIPMGRTVTYSALAKGAGNAKAVRAAGTATGRNPLSIIIPCHRVVGKDGGLGGYAGGLERKRRLLGIEGLENRK